MKLSMMSYTVARQKDHFDLKRMLDLTAELGMGGIDFVTLHDETPKTLKKMCDDRGIKVVCHTFMADLNHPTAQERQPGVETCKQGIENAVALGAPVVMLPTPAKPERSSAESRRNWIEGLKEVAPIAQDAGVTLTVENFPGKESPFVTADHFLEAAAEVPGLKLTYDSGNAGSGEDPAESFRRTASYAVHAHFKDWSVSDEPKEGYREMLDGRYYAPALIGEGCIPHKEIVEAMKSAGYDGFINIEYEGNKYDPYEGIRRAVDYLRRLGI
jgi:sugar phosphate isomerase/epimerase